MGILSHFHMVELENVKRRMIQAFCEILAVFWFIKLTCDQNEIKDLKKCVKVTPKKVSVTECCTDNVFDAPKRFGPLKRF